MKLAETSYDNSETGCCARLDPRLWEGRELEWKDKPFLKDHIRSFLHMPLNFGSVISRDHAAVEEASAYPAEPFWLTDEVSPWGSNIYLAVDRALPNKEIVHWSGTFLTRYFEGPYRNIGSWIRAMNEYVEKKGLHAEKLYFFYATCPNCAKKLGVNQVVVFAKVG